MKIAVLIWEPDALQAQYLLHLFHEAGLHAHVLDRWLHLKRAAAERGSLPTVLVFGLGAQVQQELKQLAKLRQAFPLLTLVVLSPHQDPAHGLAALAAGADDYLIQPLYPPELLARMRAHLQRTVTIAQALLRAEKAPRLFFEPLVLDSARREVTLGTQRVRLSQTQFQLLHLLCRQANQCVSRALLYRQLWQQEEPLGSRRLDNLVLALRQRLSFDATCQLETHYGSGYCLRLPNLTEMS
ncbi:MAG: winged helix-turn-helix domain-containing protein [Candidatus Sericytochromatia bacterium]